jgi:hypothetical protein
MAMVKELGIDFAQGYGLGRPEPIEQIFVRAAQGTGLHVEKRIPGGYNHSLESQPSQGTYVPARPRTTALLDVAAFSEIDPARHTENG